MEEQLPAGLGEREISEFVEDDEVEPGEMGGNATLAGFDLERAHIPPLPDRPV